MHASPRKPIHKKYRTDLLIDQQIKYIAQLENEIKRRNRADEKLFAVSSHTKLIDLVSARDFVFSDFNIDPHNSEHMDSERSQNILSDTYRSVRSELTEVDNEEDEEKDDPAALALQLKSRTSLYKKYKVNLIRYECLKKLNKELVYARDKLEKASRSQSPHLNQWRVRTEWLESEIERIILTNKKVNATALTVKWGWSFLPDLFFLGKKNW
jgi:hypothetical protein